MMRKITLFFLTTMSIVVLGGIDNTIACTNSGFGISVGANVSKPVYKVKAKSEVTKSFFGSLLRELLKNELKNNGVPENTQEIEFGNAEPDNIDLSGKAPVTYNLLKKLLSDDTLAKKYSNISGSSFDNNRLVIKNDDYYIKPTGSSITEKDYVAVQDIIDNSSVINNTTKESEVNLSKCCIAAEIGAFYNIRVLDWIIRPELAMSIPFVNRTMNIGSQKQESNQSNNTNTNNNNKSDNDNALSTITKQFDLNIKLLGGYHITERFKVLFGAGAVYSRYKMKVNVDKLDNAIYSIVSNQPENIQKVFKESYQSAKPQYDTEKAYGIWNIAGIVGLEFNINSSNMIGIEVSGGPARQLIKSSDKKSMYDINISNNWQTSVTYKYVF